MKKYKFEIAITLFFVVIIGILGYALYSDMRDKSNPTIPIAEMKNETELLTTIETTIESTTETTTKSTTQTTKQTTTETTTKKELGLYDENHDYIYIGNFKITGYTEEEGFPYGSQTAWGSTGCRPGICAMNRFQRQELGISYGDYIYIKDLGEFQVTDCTADWVTNVVDVWVYTNAEAYQITGRYEVYKIVNA